MKCEMECTKKAKVKISMSGSGLAKCLCYRHGFMYVKTQMRRLGIYDFGIYIQRPPEPSPPRQISPEARHAVTLPQDREKKREVLSVFNRPDDEDWNF